jgi:hypothetical protein
VGKRHLPSKIKLASNVLDNYCTICMLAALFIVLQKKSGKLKDESRIKKRDR